MLCPLCSPRVSTPAAPPEITSMMGNSDARTASATLSGSIVCLDPAIINFMPVRLSVLVPRPPAKCEDFSQLQVHAREVKGDFPTLFFSHSPHASPRNPDRFPDDFCFVLSETEWEVFRSQNVTANWDKIRYSPYGFTREGANQLSTALKSKVAAERSIQIMRAFSEMDDLS
jgi:hypothetical protein